MIGEDLMHHEFEGVLPWELALLLYVCIRHRDWGWDTSDFNARLDAFDFGERIPCV
jgi:hypothetical protein